MYSFLPGPRVGRAASLSHAPCTLLMAHPSGSRTLSHCRCQQSPCVNLFSHAPTHLSIFFSQSSMCSPAPLRRTAPRIPPVPRHVEPILGARSLPPKPAPIGAAFGTSSATPVPAPHLSCHPLATDAASPPTSRGQTESGPKIYIYLNICPKFMESVLLGF
jgi:hypothetical protein